MGIKANLFSACKYWKGEAPVKSLDRNDPLAGCGRLTTRRGVPPAIKIGKRICRKFGRFSSFFAQVAFFTMQIMKKKH